MKKNYKDMQEFINNLMTPEMIKDRRENFRDFQGDTDEVFPKTITQTIYE